jgi:hypothetical protein
MSPHQFCTQFNALCIKSQMVLRNFPLMRITTTSAKPSTKQLQLPITDSADYWPPYSRVRAIVHPPVNNHVANTLRNLSMKSIHLFIVEQKPWSLTASSINSKDVLSKAPSRSRKTVTHQSWKQDHVVRSQSICLSGMRAAWNSKDNPLMVPLLYEDLSAFPSFSREKMSNWWVWIILPVHMSYARLIMFWSRKGPNNWLVILTNSVG